MVCPACGTRFEGAGSFCPQCGSRVVAASPASGTVPPQYGYGIPAAGVGYGIPYSFSTRVRRNLQLLAVLWGCLAVYRLISGLAGMFMMRMMRHGNFGRIFSFGPEQIPFFSAVLPFAITVTLVMTILSGFVAYGLLQRRPWGRTMAIVMSILSLLKFPLGTAIGIYTLWAMAPAASAIEYESIVDRRPGFQQA